MTDLRPDEQEDGEAWPSQTKAARGYVAQQGTYKYPAQRGHAPPDGWPGPGEVRHGFTSDDGQLKTFDYVVANPPFSDKRWSTGIDPQHDPHGRFKHYGTPPPTGHEKRSRGLDSIHDGALSHHGSR